MSVSSFLSPSKAKGREGGRKTLLEYLLVVCERKLLPGVDVPGSKDLVCQSGAVKDIFRVGPTRVVQPRDCPR